METALDRYDPGIRKRDTQHIVNPIPKPHKKFPERYKIHQYWSRKPWYVIRAFIENYSEPGDVVLDPFVGSGVTCCEAAILRRKSIGIDLNQIAVLISRATCVSPVDVKEFENAYLKMERVLESNLEHLYLTICPDCGAPARIINTVWEDAVPSIIFFSCTVCNNKKQKSVDDNDIALIKAVETMSIPHEYPENIKMPEDSDVSTLDELYTKRNLIALSYLHNEIKKVEDLNMRLLFDIMFSSTLVRSSKLIFVNKYRFNKGVNPAGVWGEKRYWVPKEYIENNVFYYFKQRFSKIVKAKKETNNLIGDYGSVSGNCRILNQSATDLSFIPDCSVDYCFTDPPYGGTIQYLGLSTIWNAWLGDSTGIQKDKEIVMNKEKGRDEYRNLLRLAFKEIYRVLKHGRYMSVTFHSSQVSVWNALVEACGDTGFDIVNVIPQKPLKESHNQMNMTGTVKTDLIITFRKPVLKSDQSKTRIKIDVEKIVLEEAFSLLKRTSATTAEIYDRVVLKWIDLVHRMPLDKREDISLNMVFDILKKNFKSFYEREKDYKGEYRKILKWTLPDQRKGKGKNKNMGDMLDFEI